MHYKFHFLHKYYKTHILNHNNLDCNHILFLYEFAQNHHTLYIYL